MIYLLDTNTVSRLMRQKDVRLRNKIAEKLADCRLSAIVVAELEYGVSKRPDIPMLGARMETLRAMFAEVSPFDEDAAWHTGRVRAYLETLKPNAQPIGPYDTQIAGHALALGATIVTHNIGEFKRIPGLAVEDWQSEG